MSPFITRIELVPTNSTIFYLIYAEKVPIGR
jgi:hypothetical protein